MASDSLQPIFTAALINWSLVYFFIAMVIYFENAFFTNGAITARLDIINKDTKTVVIISILMILWIK